MTDEESKETACTRLSELLRAGSSSVPVPALWMQGAPHPGKADTEPDRLWALCPGQHQLLLLLQADQAEDRTLTPAYKCICLGTLSKLLWITLGNGKSKNRC